MLVTDTPLIAITHVVSPRLAECELTHLDRSPIDIGLASRQHEAYCDALERCGLQVKRLTANSDFPDSCFVEDTAIVIDEIAIITSMGVESRRGETRAIEAELKKYRGIIRINLPATIEGGDVLQIGKRFFVGLTLRTNPEGIDALAQIVEPLGYSVTAVEVDGCLHLKSAVTAIDDETVIANTNWIDPSQFRGFRIIDTPDDEPDSANVLRVGETLFLPACFPRTLELLSNHHDRIELIDISELRKAEAGLTCSSLIFRSQ